MSDEKTVSSWQFFPKQHRVALGLIVSVFLMAIFLASPDNNRLRLTLNLPNVEISENDSERLSWHWEEQTVQSGDSLSLIFDRAGLSANMLYRIMSSSTRTDALTKIKPGQKLRFAYNEHNEFVALHYVPSKLETLEIALNDSGKFTVDHIIKQPEVRLVYRTATITDSLFLAGQNANISQNMIMNMANIFGGVIDFVFDPRKGDTFDVLYEELLVEGEVIGHGDLLAASYTNQGETFTAFRYELSNGDIGYFNEDGISMRKPFLRAPLDFTRISSGFDPQRKHPIHKKVKAHRGIDYAAPRGTPIFAAGDGRIIKSGYSKANGNYVFIQHGQTYITKYVHLDKRYVKTGQRVKQREVIGTVGSTGYATGPHLHYEFLVNGVHRNPRTIFSKLPSADPIPEGERERFNEQISFVRTQYSYYSQDLALNSAQ